LGSQADIWSKVRRKIEQRAMLLGEEVARMHKEDVQLQSILTY
jgi:hypothetical protein